MWLEVDSLKLISYLHLWKTACVKIDSANKFANESFNKTVSDSPDMQNKPLTLGTLFPDPIVWGTSS